MLPVSLDCPFFIAPQCCLSSSYVLCTKCCQFLWIVHSSLPLSFVCLRPVSCYPMLPVSLDCPFFIAPQFCLSSSCVLCTKCCQFLWIVHSSLPLSFVSCHVLVYLPVSLDCPFFIATQFCLSSSCVLCVSLDCPFLLPLSFDCLRPVSCVPNVVSFSGLSILDCPSVLIVFVLCLVYQMLPVSLDCPFLISPLFSLSSSCVLCTKCCQFLWIVHSSLPLSVVCLHPVSYVPNVASFSGLSILHCPSVLFVFVLCLVYPMLPVSLDCPFFIAPQFCLSSSCVLCTKCCQFLWIVHSWLPLNVLCTK